MQNLVELRQRCLTARTNGFIIAYGDRIADELERLLFEVEETPFAKGSPEHLLALLDQLDRTPSRQEVLVLGPDKPKAEEPKAEEPKVEEPKVEEPKAEEPKVEEPKAEEPKVEEPKVEEAQPETTKERRGGRKSTKE